jgi:hypothetical protein
MAAQSVSARGGYAMTRLRGHGDLLPTGHAVARLLLAILVILLLVAALVLAGLLRSDELAFARMISDTFRGWLLP